MTTKRKRSAEDPRGQEDAAPRREMERTAARRTMGTSVKIMVEWWQTYAVMHARLYEAPIGEDGVLGEEWRDVGCALHGLLNGETGREDCGKLSATINDTLREHGCRQVDGVKPPERARTGVHREGDVEIHTVEVWVADERDTLNKGRKGDNRKGRPGTYTETAVGGVLRVFANELDPTKAAVDDDS